MGKQTRYCSGCKQSHGAPTGRRCPVVAEGLEELEEEDVYATTPRGASPKKKVKPRGRPRKKIPNPFHESGSDNDSEHFYSGTDPDKVNAEMEKFFLNINRVNKKLTAYDSRMENVENMLTRVLEHTGGLDEEERKVFKGKSTGTTKHSSGSGKKSTPSTSKTESTAKVLLADIAHAGARPKTGVKPPVKPKVKVKSKVVDPRQLNSSESGGSGGEGDYVDTEVTDSGRRRQSDHQYREDYRGKSSGQERSDHRQDDRRHHHDDFEYHEEEDRRSQDRGSGRRFKVGADEVSSSEDDTHRSRRHHKSKERRRDRHRRHQSSSSSSSSSGDSDGKSKRRRQRRRKFAITHFISKEERDKPMTLENLWTCASKLTLKMWEKGHDVGGMLRHSVFLGEKASTRSYTTNGLVKYDEGVRRKANRKGVGAFGPGDQELCVRYLGADNTRAVRRSQNQNNNQGQQGQQGGYNRNRRPQYQGSSQGQGQGQNRQPSQVNSRGSQVETGNMYCIKFNGEGCNYSPCRFPHVCSYCFKTGHSITSCYSIAGPPQNQQHRAA